jgi:hypothetical protein
MILAESGRASTFDATPMLTSMRRALSSDQRVNENWGTGG